MHSQEEQHPRLAIVCANTLMAMGLRQLLSGIMPLAGASIYHDWAALQDDRPEDFVHYFISPETLLQAYDFFHRRAARVFLLTEQSDSTLLPREFRRFNPSLPEDQLVKAFLLMEQTAHGQGQHMPAEMQRQMHSSPLTDGLTAREKEVLKEVACGKLNKEIADHLNISLTTVISHRRNLTDKLGIKTISGLTVYAVTHGLVSVDDI